MNSVVEAVLCGDVEQVRESLAALEASCGKETKAVNKALNRDLGQTVLHLSCLAGKSKVVELVLKHEPDLLQMDAKSRLAIHCAVESGDEETTKLVMDALEGKGWACKALKIRDSRDLTPLHLACSNPETLEILLQHVSSPESLWDETLFKWALTSAQSFQTLSMLHNCSPIPSQLLLSKSPLLVACERGSLTTAQFLYSIGADVLARDAEEQNILHWATMLEHDDFIEWIQEIDTDNKLAEGKDVHGKLPRDYAAVQEEQEEAEDREISLLEQEQVVEELIQQSYKVFHMGLDAQPAPPPLPPPSEHAHLHSEQREGQDGDQGDLRCLENVRWKKDREDLEQAIAKEMLSLEQLGS